MGRMTASSVWPVGHVILPLFQGKDDLRQDAVMQQVFVLVNRLLMREPITRKRKLSIRTYKVSLLFMPWSGLFSFTLSSPY